MNKFLLFILLIISAALAVIYFAASNPQLPYETLPERGPLHYYQNAEAPIEKIHALALYFVPKNKIASAIPDWRETLETNIKALQRFHAFQFQGRSQVSYEIYPRAVIGRQDNMFYDTEITQHGNPEALRRTAEELEERLFRPGGDLYDAYWAAVEPGVYRVMIVMYEGVGASGSGNTAFVSRIFFSDPRYRSMAATTLAHEFYHTLGIPDAYELSEAIPTSQDIMGLGRSRPLEKTYIEKNTLYQLGL
ncbi:MAG: hypothetical protein AAB604_00770 [Patescibacteria group bacterium]